MIVPATPIFTCDLSTVEPKRRLLTTLTRSGSYVVIVNGSEMLNRLTDKRKARRLFTNSLDSRPTSISVTVEIAKRRLSTNRYDKKVSHQTQKQKTALFKRYVNYYHLNVTWWVCQNVGVTHDCRKAETVNLFNTVRYK